MVDYSLYLVTDRKLALGRQMVEVVEAAIAGGVSCVQLREKECSTREFLSEAHRLRKVLCARNIPLIINDRVDIALAVEAEGVHLGQSDMPIQDARRLVGNSMVIGVSAESIDDAIEAEAGGADYIGISPVFTTTTKEDIATPLGLDGIRAIREVVRIPLVAIGGIGQDNAQDVMEAGADGVAVVSAIVSAVCPETAARNLFQVVANLYNQNNEVRGG